MYKLYYSRTEGRRLRASLSESGGQGFKPLIELAESEPDQFEDAMIFLARIVGDFKVALWSDRLGIRWTEQGEERWL